jgi:hypothetical protein
LRHRFQSFWHGGQLSPYEQFCLKSFVDCDHHFDLYTFDLNLAVPTGIQVRDASEVMHRDEVFTYQQGFGKGSPSAFSNLFRYKLLAEKGGWWVDTDVVCLTKDIPNFREFFARQGPYLVCTAIMYFEPHNPIMQQCLDEAIKSGRAVTWGQTGPNLFTRILKGRNCFDRALAPSTCYPIHWSQAGSLLLPDAMPALAPLIKSASFLHIWNQMLVSQGIQKTYLPPRGSLLRMLVDRHPASGWTNEYV